jgi:hypothetical protein
LSSQTDSKTLKEEQREELFESLKVNSFIGWEVDVICPKDLSAKMLKKYVWLLYLSNFKLGLVIFIDSPIASGRKLILMKYHITLPWALLEKCLTWEFYWQK